MIAYLKGKVIITLQGIIILDVNGVGYKINIGKNEPHNEGSEKTFFIHEHIREDSDEFYGFENYADLELFEKLISVNGVGPKAGLAIMAAAPSERILSAIIEEDLAFFQSISGIGKKVAAKIILELKGKISGLSGSGVIAYLNQSDEIIEALVSLGYKKNEIMRFLTKVPSNIVSSEEKIHWFLKHIAR